MGEPAETVAANGGGEINWLGSRKAHNIDGWQKENRSRSASEVGGGEGAAEEGGLAAWGACCEYAAGSRA
jgi:hypothetical protein